MTDLKKALELFIAVRPGRETLIDYFNGRHRLMFATERFRSTFGEMLASMRDNLCPIVVEATADRMEVINFSAGGSAAEIARQAWELWQREQMETNSYRLHVEAIRAGAGYVIVWPDDAGRARFYVQDSRNCVVIRDPDTDDVRYAAKLWKGEDKRLRLNIYYADRVLKFASRNTFEAGVSGLRETEFVPLDIEPETPNPYGIVPVFEFQTSPILENAIPIQNALNKTVCDKLVAMEFAAFRQRYATGLEFPTDDVTGERTMPFKAGADRLWATDRPEAKFGEFAEADLTQFLKVADSYRLEMARVTGTPLHFFSINTSDAMSGEALKTLESRFTKRITRMCLAFGPVWAAAMDLALRIEGIAAPGEMTVQWTPAEQRSEREALEALALKRDTLDVPVDVLREEYGYTEEDIQRFNRENMILLEPEPGGTDDE